MVKSLWVIFDPFGLSDLHLIQNRPNNILLLVIVDGDSLFGVFALYRHCLYSTFYKQTSLSTNSELSFHLGLFFSCEEILLAASISFQHSLQMASRESGSTGSSDDQHVFYSLNRGLLSQGSDDDDGLLPGDVDDSDADNYARMNPDSEHASDDSDEEIDKELDQSDADTTSSTSPIGQWINDKDLDAKLPIFDGEFRMKDDVQLPRNPTPFDFFNLFLTRDIVNYIVEQSNLYRTQEDFKQEPMNQSDFYRLLGFLFYSSLIRLPSKSDYWSSGCGLEIIMQSVARDRVDQLLRTLHFNDNVLQTEPTDKIQSLIDLFNDRCESVVHPEQFIAIDEQMIKYKGASAPKSLKQYMPQKPTKRGFKFWSRCGSSLYTYQVKLYKGSNKHRTTTQSTRAVNRDDHPHQTRSTTSIDDDQEELIKRNDLKKRIGESGLVVLDLLDRVPEGTHVFVDNYFGSIGLLREMTSRGYDLTCTLRANRIGDCPIESEKAMKKRQRGYFDYRLSKDKKMIIVGWYDNRRVLLGSNAIGIEPLTSLSRWDRKQKQKIPIDTPQIVRLYNKNMGSVDSVDMFCALHPIPFRSKKWYIRIAWRIFELMIINAWILWKRVTEGNDNGWRISRFFSFKLYIAKLLLQSSATIEIRSRIKPSRALPSSSSDDDDHAASDRNKRKREMKSGLSTIIRFDGIEHWPDMSGVTRIRCKDDGCSNKTNVFCTKCQVHLCLTTKRNCFKNFHCTKT